MKSLETPRFVFDTNVILNALSPKLPYRYILQRLFDGQCELCVTTDILCEYEEKISDFYSPITAKIFLDALMMSSCVRKIDVFYKFNLLKDMDDNKFID